MCDIVCEDGWGDCDAAVGCETHTDIDAASCRRCGHDCLGGGCAGGRCQPLELATGQQTRVLAVDGPYLYWNARQPAPNGRILRIDTSGAGSIEIVADGLHMPGFFAVDTSNVYIALNAQSCSPNSQPCIGRSLKSPADPTINLFYSTTVIATGLAAAGGWLYYREGTEVKRVASTLQFGASVLASGQATSGSELMVSSDGSTLHWANGDAMPYEVWSAATDGSGATAIGSVADWPVAITQLGDDLYISGVNGSLAVLPRSASGEAASVVTSLAGIFGSLASTANEVVFVVGGQPITWVKPDGAGGFVIEADLVVNVPVDFGAGEVVVTADAAAVYWVDGSTGTIFKLAR
jgi:hypothetical protein